MGYSMPSALPLALDNATSACESANNGVGDAQAQAHRSQWPLTCWSLRPGSFRAMSAHDTT